MSDFYQFYVKMILCSYIISTRITRNYLGILIGHEKNQRDK